MEEGYPPREKDSLSFTSASRRADRRACHRDPCARRPPPSSTSSRRGVSPFPKTHKHARRTLTNRSSPRLVSSRPILSLGAVLCFCKIGLIMLKYVEPSRSGRRGALPVWTKLSGRTITTFVLYSRGVPERETPKTLKNRPILGKWKRKIHKGRILKFCQRPGAQSRSRPLLRDFSHAPTLRPQTTQPSGPRRGSVRLGGWLEAISQNDLRFT